MTSASNRDTHFFHCDSCDEERTIYSDSFVDAWGSLKEEGWTTFKMGGEWHHECPDCSD